MRKRKIIIAGLMANTLAACSSPPKLTEPEGDWVSFETPQISIPVHNEANPSECCTRSSAIILNKSIPQITKPATREFSFVKSDGKNVPLFKAVKAVLPPSMNVRLAPDVAQNFRGNVSWTGNDQWPYVLRKMLSPNGLEAVINQGKDEVVIQYAQKAKLPVSKPEDKPLLNKPKLATSIVSLKETKALKTPLVPVATQGTPPLNVKPKPASLALPVFKTWTIEKGTTLKAGFSAWAAKEICPSSRKAWSIRWETDTNYPIDYPLSFSSTSFEDATSQLFNLYRKAQAPLYVSGYRNQCLIIISDKK